MSLRVVHSVRIELAKLILVGTRITYQATGEAGYVSKCFTHQTDDLYDLYNLFPQFMI